MPRNLDYKSDLQDDLRNDPEFAAAYLSAAMGDSSGAFLIALRDVAEARKGMSRLAAAANVNRESLYRSLSKGGNPRFDTFTAIIGALGLQLKFEPVRPSGVRSSRKSGSARRRVKR
jgi:probable addiction module antidote protein